MPKYMKDMKTQRGEHLENFILIMEPHNVRRNRQRPKPKSKHRSLTTITAVNMAGRGQKDGKKKRIRGSK
jgi:hypothetical protein